MNDPPGNWTIWGLIATWAAIALRWLWHGAVRLYNAGSGRATEKIKTKNQAVTLDDHEVRLRKLEVQNGEVVATLAEIRTDLKWLRRHVEQSSNAASEGKQ